MAKKKISAPEGACVDQAGGLMVTRQNKILHCSVENITNICEELRAAGVDLRAADGRTQQETLARALQYRGARGLSTFEGTAAGYLRLACRVRELKTKWDIYTLKEDVVGPDGLLHKGVARYVLLGRRKSLCDQAPSTITQEAE